MSQIARYSQKLTNCINCETKTESKTESIECKLTNSCNQWLKSKYPLDIGKNLFLILALFYAIKHCFPNPSNVGLKSKDCKPLKENHLLHRSVLNGNETFIIITNLRKSLYIVLQMSVDCLLGFQVINAPNRG